MILKKTTLSIVFFAAILFICQGSGFTKTSGTLTVPSKIEPKILVKGSSQYLGYLNAYLTITKKGVPQNGLEIYLDNLKLMDRGSGNYSNGTPFSYNIKVGNVIRIRQKPSKSSPIREKVGKKELREILLGSYKVNNTIQWVFPKPDGVIPLGRVAGAAMLTQKIKFQWNYTGRVLKTKVTIKDFTKNVEIFNQIVTGESVLVPKSLFKAGRKYRFDLEVDGPMGKFVMTDNVARGSEILFYYWGHIYFMTK